MNQIVKSIQRHYRKLYFKQKKERRKRMNTIKSILGNIRWTREDTYTIVYHVVVYAGQLIFVQFKIENPQYIAEIQGVFEIIRRLFV